MAEKPQNITDMLSPDLRKKIESMEQQEQQTVQFAVPGNEPAMLDMQLQKQEAVDRDIDQTLGIKEMVKKMDDSSKLETKMFYIQIATLIAAVVGVVIGLIALFQC